ncbi:MAG: hypothetical protein D6760_09780 [Deltaproteobacteria bacterium]|nr:MAG: hypothetical protein D6760_09780 [Deltaproteobacteria bacterium]
MNRRSNGSVLVTLAAAAALMAMALPAHARNFDIGLGGGGLFGIEENLPVKDNYYAGIFSAIRLRDQFDAELSAARSEGIDTADGSFREIYHATAGFRFYPMTAPDRATRFYVAFGASVFFDLKRNDDSTLGAYLGPGFRLKAGEHSGIDLRAPLVFSGEGATNTVILPTVSWFYEF